MADTLKILEFIPGTKFAKKMACNLCGEVVYQVSDHPTLAECEIESVGLAAHVEFRHGLKFVMIRCSDPSCGRIGKHDHR
jgi:hypothetical protein